MARIDAGRNARIQTGRAALCLPVTSTQPRNSRYVTVLAVAACLILIGGWLARPREIPLSPPPLPSETEIQQLARRTQRRSLADMTSYFAGVARSAAASIAEIRPAGISGIVWNEQRIVTGSIDGGRIAGIVTVANASGEAGVRPTMWGPNLPVMAFANPDHGNGSDAVGLRSLTPPHRAESLAAAGDWVVAVWRTGADPAFAPGTFSQTASIMCGVPAQEIVSTVTLTHAMVGGGLFDVDSNLLGVIVPCAGARLATIVTASIDAMLQRENTNEQRLLGQYGIAVGPMSADEQRHFKTTTGMLVREVWTGFAGDAAGLRPGDIITHLSGRSITSPDDLRTLADSTEAASSVTVQRGAQRLAVVLRAHPLESDTAAAAAGVTWEVPARTYAIASVRPGSPAAQAGVESGDRLVRIDHAEPRNVDQIERIFAAGKTPSVWLEVDRGGRLVGMLIVRGDAS